MTETDIVNFALAKIGGGGEQATGTGFIADIDAPENILAARCRFLFSRCRQKAIIDLANMDCPFCETIRYADLGNEVATPPAMGDWDYCFNIPGDSLSVVNQINEADMSRPIPGQRKMQYNFKVVLNAAKDGKVLLTNDLTNTAETSAYILYVVDVENVNVFSLPLSECIAMLLAIDLCPLIGKDPKIQPLKIAEYQQVTIPNAQIYNQSQFDTYCHTPIPDYKGGRLEGD